jgi:lipopolysaccharide transport protein LptA
MRALAGLLAIGLVMLLGNGLAIAANSVGNGALEADLIEWDIENDKFTATGNCALKLDQGRMTCDEVVATLSADLSSVLGAQAQGNLRFEGQYTTSEGNQILVKSTAGFAKYLANTGNLAFGGGVDLSAVGIMDKARSVTLKAPEATYSQREQLFTAEGSSTLTLLSGDEDKTTSSKLTSGKLSYSLKEGKAVASEKARIEAPEGTLVADSLIAQMAQNTGLASAEATGNVTVESLLATSSGGKRKATGHADHATYSAAESKIVLTGNVTLQLAPQQEGQSPPTVKGERIILLIDQGKVRVEKGLITGAPEAVQG